MAKTVARGTILRVTNPATAAFVAVGNLTSLGLPSPETPEIDVTDFDSVAAEFLPGLLDNGEMPFTGFQNATDAGQIILFDDAHNAEAPIRVYQVDFVRQDMRYTFSAWVKSFELTAGGPNEAYTFSGALRITGAVVDSAIP